MKALNSTDNWHDTDDSPASESQVVASLQYHFVPNVKLNFEYVYADIIEGQEDGVDQGYKDNLFQTNLRFGF